MNHQQRTTAQLFLVLLAAIALFAAFIAGLELGVVEIWAITTTLALVLVVVVALVRGRRG